ncbi:lysophospholipid acyltransferase family protein [Spelaeicoccus albus]|uniref:1-acyl-sn-glycerol-3-phosphate acyltransferase n=1 Tax=Spelaeicoccus albus TaxID=1280376 RepID=A0A7Z0IHP7_9MICO|nr:1-acyl-sn-glycerol-3-phosphate acyltransferase [Spelaeicoccus albus]
MTSSAPGDDAGVNLLANTLRPVMNMLAGHDWAGAHNVPPTGPVIVCPNHISHLDPIVVGHYLYNNGRSPYFLTKSGLFRFGPAGWALRRAGQIPVMRGTDQASHSLGYATEALEAGKLVVVYPEGTLTRDPNLWPMRGKTGAARLALETGAPVIPIAHWGIQEVLGPYKKIPKLLPRRRVQVLTGPPIDLSRFAERSADVATLHEITDVIQAGTVDLLAKLRGETPPERLYAGGEKS